MINKKFRDLNILLVEDNVLNQKLISYIFKKYDISISIVVNGKEALNALNDNSFDVILMDVMMPVLDGYQTTKIIREGNSTSSSSVIIGLTSGIYDSEKEKCISVGMNYFMSKPFDFSIFKELMISEGVTEWT